LIEKTPGLGNWNPEQVNVNGVSELSGMKVVPAGRQNVPEPVWLMVIESLFGGATGGSLANVKVIVLAGPLIE